MKDKLITSIGEFANANSDLLVIVCDPRSDNLFMSYGGVVAMNKIKGVDGKKMTVVKDVLKHSLFKSRIDTFLGGLIDFMKLDDTLPGVNQFLQWIDGSLFNIAKKLRLNKAQRGIQVENSLKYKSNPVETPIV